MSVRAAWRLESLGFTRVYRYTAGKADWFAYGLPMEGARAEVPRIGALARKDVPTCRLDDRIGEVRERVQAAGWDLCLVVNEHTIVLGRLRQAQLDGDPSLSAQEIMEEGPTTYRPNRPAEEVANYLAKRRVPGILVTTNDGELIGVFYRKDVEQATR
ncbi:MAG: CBS domain-containing protein [Chloroflexi bacterium]|nr:CBS domain-containing protein [Chloroflexota bacterium]